jgi:hypothetical protein
MSSPIIYPRRKILNKLFSNKVFVAHWFHNRTKPARKKERTFATSGSFIVHKCVSQNVIIICFQGILMIYFILITCHFVADVLIVQLNKSVTFTNKTCVNFYFEI